MDFFFEEKKIFHIRLNIVDLIIIEKIYLTPPFCLDFVETS